MRLTYTAIWNAHLRNIGRPSLASTDSEYATILADFQYSLGTRYQLIYGKVASYINQGTQTASTVAAQQYYYYPVGTQSIDAATITIGSRIYPLNPIYSQEGWNAINAIPFQATVFPQFIFPRRDDFGVWPIPQDVYTISFQGFNRDRNLLVDDYSSGTVALTAGSTTITGTNTTFTAAMVGRWFSVTDTATAGQGYWYRIGGYNSATSLTLETFWAAATASPATYVIGETPELPEDAHILLPTGTAADYYSGMRNDPLNAVAFSNQFYTGDKNNPTRDQASKNVMGGLIGLIQSYEDRERDNIVERQPLIRSRRDMIWSQTIS